MDSQNKVKEYLKRGPSIFDYKSFDASAWALIFSNLIMIVLALAERWDLGTIMLSYWCQSVIIGIFNVVKILNFDTDVPWVNAKGRPVNPAVPKIFMAGFFALHYGFFHFGYYSFLSGTFRTANHKDVLFACSIFLINHLFSLVYNLRKDRAKLRDLGKLMTGPYIRIIPMHLTIMAGFFLAMIAMVLKLPVPEQPILIFFLLLKTSVDLKMHLAEHAARPGLEGQA